MPGTGKRSTQGRGRARRAALLSAAREMLGRHELDSISLGDVAEHAGIPKGSAYYFYKDIHEIYMELVELIGLELQDLLAKSLDGPYETWMDVVADCVELGRTVYATDPAARQLLVGPKTPPEIKRADRRNDLELGNAFERQMGRFFELPDLPGRSEIFFRTIEIMDLMFCLSVMDHGEITAAMAEEAKRAATAYLSLYLPPYLPKKKPE
ncbi:MAG TPA: TetR family transcriptional regulator [Sphingomonadales bacterium]